ncbi:oxidoreductase [Thozetella sp. PMI_491]|nr:oxidoreductase [Thozetella sp. PMI_491]
MARPLKVLICGGGIAGPSLAFWLSRLGCDVTIIERDNELRASGQQIDIRAQGISVMRKMGIESAVRAHLVHEPGMQFINGRGKRVAFFGVNTSGKGAQSFSAEIEIMRGDMCNILYEATKSTTRYVFGKYVEDFEQFEDDKGNSGVKVRFSDGTEDTADLLVGADGQSSRMRRLMTGSGVPDPVDRKRLSFALYSIPAEKGDTNVMTGYYIPGSRMVITRKDSPEFLRVYLLAMNNRMSEAHPLKKSMQSGSSSSRSSDIEAQKRAWADLFHGTGWQTERFIRGMDSPEASDWYSFEAMQVKMDSWSKGRVVLLGDAAFTASPARGMGAPLSIVGAYVLAGELAHHCKLGTDADPRQGIAAALQAYDRTYRPFVDNVQKLPPGVPGILFPSSKLGVSFLLWLLWLISALRIDKLLERLAGEDVPGWDIPEYPELDRGT